jgi:hypothetical protein
MRAAVVVVCSYACWDRGGHAGPCSKRTCPKKYDEISASAWHLLEERNEALAPMLKTFTAGNITSVREAVSFTATLLNKNADSRGESYVQKMCTTYPEFLETMNEDFEPKVTSQMDALQASFQ